MPYQVWTKDEFEGWKRKDCESLKDAQAEILLSLKAGKEPVLTQDCPYNIIISMEKEKIIEAVKTKTEPGESTGAKGKSKV